MNFFINKVKYVIYSAPAAIVITALILSLRAKRPDISALLRIFIVPAAMALLIGAVVMI